tara:strand:+ start:366 stop:575 length:210 start_codon:yes stop_codon:yes gene_type:complete
MKFNIGDAVHDSAGRLGLIEGILRDGNGFHYCCIFGDEKEWYDEKDLYLAEDIAKAREDAEAILWRTWN